MMPGKFFSYQEHKLERTIPLKNLDFFRFSPDFFPVYVVAHFVHHILIALPAPLLPLIRIEFDLSYTRAAKYNFRR
jgi:hypothetical protein